VWCKLPLDRSGKRLTRAEWQLSHNWLVVRRRSPDRAQFLVNSMCSAGLLGGLLYYIYIYIHVYMYTWTYIYILYDSYYVGIYLAFVISYIHIHMYIYIYRGRSSCVLRQPLRSGGGRAPRARVLLCDVSNRTMNGGLVAFHMTTIMPLCVRWRATIMIMIIKSHDSGWEFIVFFNSRVPRRLYNTRKRYDRER